MAPQATLLTTLIETVLLEKAEPEGFGSTGLGLVRVWWWLQSREPGGPRLEAWECLHRGPRPESENKACQRCWGWMEMCGNRRKKGEGESLEDEGQRIQGQEAAGRVGEVSVPGEPGGRLLGAGEGQRDRRARADSEGAPVGACASSSALSWGTPRGPAS